MLQPSYINIYRGPNVDNPSLLGTINASGLESIEWGRQNINTDPTDDVFYITGCYTLSNSDHDWVIQITAINNFLAPMGQTYSTDEDKIAIMNHIVDQLVRLTQKMELATESNVQAYYPPNTCDLGSMSSIFNPFQVIKGEDPGMGEGLPPGFGEEPPPGEGPPEAEVMPGGEELPPGAG